MHRQATVLLVLAASSAACAASTPEAEPPTPVVVEVDAPSTSLPALKLEEPEKADAEPSAEEAEQADAEAEAAFEAKMQAVADAEKVGILGVLKAGPGPTGGVLGGPPGMPSGVLHSIGGPPVGKAFGAGGLGRGGGGLGGGGSGGAIGLGTIGTIGHGGGGKTTAPGPRVRGAKVVVQGSLDRAVIQRVVRSHFGRIRGCYQKELRSKPGVAGRLLVRFVIGTDGKVSKVAGGGTVNSEPLHKCVVAQFRGMVFPKPRNGVVVVNYPIVFQSAGTTPAGKAKSTP
jgi:hypothetical protein